MVDKSKTIYNVSEREFLTTPLKSPTKKNTLRIRKLQNFNEVWSKKPVADISGILQIKVKFMKLKRGRFKRTRDKTASGRSNKTLFAVEKRHTKKVGDKVKVFYTREFIKDNIKEAFRIAFSRAMAQINFSPDKAKLLESFFIQWIPKVK